MNGVSLWSTWGVNCSTDNVPKYALALLSRDDIATPLRNSAAGYSRGMSEPPRKRSNAEGEKSKIRTGRTLRAMTSPMAEKCSDVRVPRLADVGSRPRLCKNAAQRKPVGQRSYQYIHWGLLWSMAPKTQTGCVVAWRTILVARKFPALRLEEPLTRLGSPPPWAAQVGEQLLRGHLST